MFCDPMASEKKTVFASVFAVAFNRFGSFSYSFNYRNDCFLYRLSQTVAFSWIFTQTNTHEQWKKWRMSKGGHLKTHKTTTTTETDRNKNITRPVLWKISAIAWNSWKSFKSKIPFWHRFNGKQVAIRTAHKPTIKQIWKADRILAYSRKQNTHASREKNMRRTRPARLLTQIWPSSDTHAFSIPLSLSLCVWVERNDFCTAKAKTIIIVFPFLPRINDRLGNCVQFITRN